MKRGWEKGKPRRLPDPHFHKRMVVEVEGKPFYIRNRRLTRSEGKNEWVYDGVFVVQGCGKLKARDARSIYEYQMERIAGIY